MKIRHPLFHFCFLVFSGTTLLALPIPGLFNTGVSTNNTLLLAGAIDPHYQIIASDDPGFPGPNAFTLSAGFPVPPWIAEGPDSRWIAPRAQQGTGNAEGNYTYRTTFSLAGFDPAKASIAGKWAVDNGGVDIVLNGASLGIINNLGFTSFSDFAIVSGFVTGTNTLDFIVSNAPTTPNPTGLRVEMRGTVELPSEAPSIVVQPVGANVVTGETANLSVTADGTPPLTFQWRFNGTNVVGATETNLVLTGLTAQQSGAYTVVVGNSFGSVTSVVANVTVSNPIPGLFNTGVGSNGAVLDDYAIDPHYQLSLNANDAATTDTTVQDSTVFPIVSGPWVANSDTSKWIGPIGETSAAAGGDYTYRLRFDLTGLDPATAFITGLWSTDNEGTGIRLNGISLGLRNSAQFGSFTAFSITNGFLSGTNTLEFSVNNAGGGYTGLRVDQIRGGALKKTGPSAQAPKIVQQPLSQSVLVGESATLSVVADSTLPLSFQWKLNDNIVVGATAASLVVSNVQAQVEGSYTVTISNSAGQTVSAPAVLTVLERVPGLFNTGVGVDGKVLADLQTDPHYLIVTNAQDSASTAAPVEDSTVFPIVAGPWVANTDASKWIGPLGETSAAAGGDYAYKLEFDLTGFDPATAFVAGLWATDNLGLDILLNGKSTGLHNDAQFTSYTAFTLTNGFTSGRNKLEFVLNNAAAGYTGLRIDALRGGAKKPASTQPALTVTRSGKNQITLSWPRNAGDFNVFASETIVAGTWAKISEPIQSSGDQNSVVVGVSGKARFFRLQR